ncbi:MAG: hypothetical protein ABI461_19510, partial [Polyangiaceae bacterium]
DDPFELVGDLIDGQFRVDAFVGFGDLSVVYRGFHIGVDANVAIKFLDLPTTLDDALVAPLVRSFREGTKLHYRLARGHMHIAQSIGSGQTLAPRTGAVVPYLVREWLEGMSLGHDFNERRARGLSGRSLVEAVDLFRGALEGLAYAHRQGVPHLALNPSNLFLAQSGPEIRLKILDFGVAHAMNEHAGPIRARKSSPHQPTGLRVLVPAYAAPEQLDAAVGQSGAWTDVYAMALLFVEALCDAPMFGVAPPTLDQAVRPTARRTTLPANLDPRVAAVLERALMFAPRERHASAGVFWKDLSEALPTRAAAIVRRPSTAPKMPAMRRSPTLVGLNSTPAPFPAPTTRPPPPDLSPGPAPKKSNRPQPSITGRNPAPTTRPPPPMPPQVLAAARPSNRPPPPPSRAKPSNRPPPLRPAAPAAPIARPITKPFSPNYDDAPTRQELAMMQQPLRVPTPIAEPMYVEQIARASNPLPTDMAIPRPPSLPMFSPKKDFTPGAFSPMPPPLAASDLGVTEPMTGNANQPYLGSFSPFASRNTETVMPPGLRPSSKKIGIIAGAVVIGALLLIGVVTLATGGHSDTKTATHP